MGNAWGKIAMKNKIYKFKLFFYSASPSVQKKYVLELSNASNLLKTTVRNIIVKV